MRARFFIVLSILLSVVPADAQTYPSRPIRLLVAYPPGGIADLAARIVGEGLRAKLNQSVIIENKPGANGSIGTRELIRSDPDGYTLMMSPAAMLISYAMDANAAYDPMRDMVPIAGAAEYATAMVVNNNMPVGSVGEFIAYAKAKPARLSFGSTGVGSLDYLAAMLFMKQTGIDMVHVPYKGGPLALNDLLAGSIDTIIEVFPVVMEQIKARSIKGLAVSSAYRLPSIPDVPTFAEAGVPNVELTGWLGLYAPAGLPEGIREKLSAAVVEVVKQPDIQEKFRAIGFEPMRQDAKAFAALHAAEVKRWLAFIAEIGLWK
jgi:tripartite-type tricarboxylate transporter receptor subunit TctC